MSKIDGLFAAIRAEVEKMVIAKLTEKHKPKRKPKPKTEAVKPPAEKKRPSKQEQI